MSILESIKGHDDLVKLNDSQRDQLCGEIRDFLVAHIARTGGHLASNLGVVELTVALETVFNTQKDRLVFDVGHQSYVHKLLTGRQTGFDTLRQFGGMAGFPKPGESQTDAFVAGHASSSVSIALGMARARSLQNENYHVIALLGDGAATGGMVYEGLNDAAESHEPMIVILNDNEMSIDRNVGGMAKHLARIRSKNTYLGMKRAYRTFLGKLPGGRGVYLFTRRIKDWLKRVLLPTTLFDNMGLTYLGPVDGHDVNSLITLLRAAADMKRPVVLHVLTQKGRGYAPAESDPSLFHGVGKFDPDTGASAKKSGATFSSAFGETMCSLAQEDDRVCAITAAMPGGTGLLSFKSRFPRRTFDVGIAEEHAVSMAGGLAKQGMIPVVALYSTFLQRSFDMILQDVSMQELHVVFAIDRCGLVGEDGETHHGVFDVGFLRQAPGMRILSPGSIAEQQAMLRWAVKDCTGPVAVRYPRGGDRFLTENCWTGDACAAVTHRDGADVTFLTYGVITENVLQAADLLEQHGIYAKVIRLLQVWPLPLEALSQMVGSGSVIFAEEAAFGAGVAEAACSALTQRIPGLRAFHRDLGPGFVSHGDIPSLYRSRGLDGGSLASYAMEVLNYESKKTP